MSQTGSRGCGCIPVFFKYQFWIIWNEMGCLLSIELSPMNKALLQGQWISILIAGTGIFATILSDTHPSTNFPLLMNSCNYILLTSYLLRRLLKTSLKNETKSTTVVHNPVAMGEDDEVEVGSSRVESSSDDFPAAPTNLWWYLAAAILDVEANYLVLLAYNYTTITSVMLLDCFTIPCAMFMSYVFLGCRYRFKHIAGTCICLTGLACIVVNDIIHSNEQRGSNPLLGDMLCLGGAVLYASSNVLQEHLVKFHDREQFLGYLGCFGFVIAFTQCIFIDIPRMKHTHFTGSVIGAMFGFVICLFLMYTNTTSFLQHSDAILFNLGLLTSDVYAVIFTYFFYGYLVSWLYFMAFLLVIVGLVTYHLEEKPIQIGRDLGDFGLFGSINPYVTLRISGGGGGGDLKNDSIGNG